MRRLCCVAVLAVVLPACGQAGSTSSTKFKGQEKVVADTVGALQSAGQRKDAGKICKEILARELVAAIQRAGADCRREMKAAIDDADDYTLDVVAVRIVGDSADVRVKGRAGKKNRLATFRFHRESGRWRATSLAPGP